MWLIFGKNTYTVPKDNKKAFFGRFTQKYKKTGFFWLIYSKKIKISGDPKMNGNPKNSGNPSGSPNLTLKCAS